MTESKHQPTCPECTLGWLEEITLRGELWAKCMSCGHMHKVAKRTVTIVGD